MSKQEKEKQIKKENDALDEVTKDMLLLLEKINFEDKSFLEYYIQKYSYLLTVRNELPTELRRIQYHISGIYKNRRGPTKAIAKLINQLEKSKKMQWRPEENDSKGNEKPKAV